MKNPPIYFPDAKLSHLFERAENHPFKNGQPTNKDKSLIWANTSSLGSHYWYLKPTEMVRELVKKMNSICTDPNIYFNFTLRSDNTVLITAQYNSIIGSRWLVIVSKKEVEEFLS